MRKLKLLKKDEYSLPIKGQGVYLFSTDNFSTQECQFELYSSKEDDSLFLHFSNHSLIVIHKNTGEEYKDPSNNVALVNLSGAYYWFSLDSKNMCFYAGLGEARMETVFYKYIFSNSVDKNNENIKRFLENIDKVIVKDTCPIQILKDPITDTIPLLVFDKDELNMDIVAKQDIMPSSNLSLTSQKIYNCVAGKNFVLDNEDFPYFSQAIENSIKTPGLWCYKKLLDKATEFNKDHPNTNETYLRITLGKNNGESPGIPYVMEIWPPGHYSPIHSHANAEAVIRVLHGEINVSLYPFLCGEKNEDGGIKPFGTANFSQNDITWISPTLNQTHKLHNIHNLQTCITIQCYMYDDDNSKHYDYFDYIDVSGNIQQYEPDSDMDFLSFKELMKKEWNENNNNTKKNHIEGKTISFSNESCCSIM